MAKKPTIAQMQQALSGKPGYRHHTAIKPDPEVGTRFRIRDTGGLAPITPVSPESMLGGSFGISPWDTAGSHEVQNVSGHDLLDPVQLEAGQNFPRMLKNIAEQRGGASGRKVVEGQQERITRAHAENMGRKGTGKVYTSPSTMAETSPFFSHMPIEIMLDLLAQRGLAPEDYDKLDTMIKKKKGMGHFKGLQDPNLWEKLITPDPNNPKRSIGKMRKAVTEALATKEGQKMLDYNIEDLLGAVRDPDLRGVPTGYTGRILLEGHPNAAPKAKDSTPSPFMESNHTSYDTGHRQTYLGGSHNAPVEVWMPHSYETEKAAILAKNPELANDPGLRGMVINALAWGKKPHSYQHIDDRVLRNLQRFEEGVKAGYFQPNDLAAVMDFFNRKHKGFDEGGTVEEPSMDEMLAHVMLHKAEGGTVDLANVGVEEAPDMSVKSYINPGPQSNDQMPVGGVDMIPVQPGQQLMPSPSPGGMPQPAGQPPGMQIPQDGPQNPLAQLGSPKGTPPMGGAPMGMPTPPQGGLPQGVQPQGPQVTSMSNLLNLTRPGQALNAMKPVGMPR